ncbi:MAG: tripartite tricarboxylate transporter substrate binding protein [Burkholderiaceae bacterium]|jgi:tripartite-type tricarboxylate transporter receptor subunit TctC|nr:tripartite tricarboxylate transporter substrate binding protein [Burkholderiaceae bacterium]
MSTILRIAAASLVALGAIATAPAQAQAWPNKTIRLIAVFPPGGSVDQVARILSQQLGKQLGQSVVVENVGGASGSIGTNAVAKAAPDGYTFGVVFDTHGTNASLIPNIQFDTLKDIAQVTLIGTSPMALVGSAKSKYATIGDMLADARTVKGINIGSIGTGSLGHLAMIQAGNQGGWSWTHVPYRGGGPLMNDAVAGHIPIAIGTVFLVMPHVKNGTVKPLAVTGARRSPALPDTPTLAEAGIKNFEALAYWGVIAPGKTPPDIVNRMNSEVQKALKDPAVAERLSAQGMTVTGQGPAEFSAFMKKEVERWAKIVKENRISAGG